MSNKPFKIGQKVKFKAHYKREYPCITSVMLEPLEITAIKPWVFPNSVLNTCLVRDAEGKEQEFFMDWLITARNGKR